MIDLWILKTPCIPGIKSTWSWCMIFLICCWILFARILLRIFASMFIIAIDLWFCLFVASLSGLVIRVMVASKSEFVSLPSSATYWKSLRRIGVRSSLKFLVGFTCEAIWSCFFFFFFLLEGFWVQFGFPWLWLVCLDFLFLPGSDLEVYAFLSICLFLPSCPFFWHIVADSSLLWSFVFLCCLL